jgi:phage terminase small subunit
MSKRPYKPTKLKILEGRRGHRPLPENEPMPRPITPEIPDDLDDNAKKVWQRVAPMVERLSLLTEVDGEMFGGLCQIRSRLQWINNELGNLNNDEKRLAWLQKEQRMYLKLFRDYAKEFGLTPVGRIGLAVNTDTEMSEFEKLLD